MEVFDRYKVKILGSGQLLFRNRQFLRKTIPCGLPIHDDKKLVDDNDEHTSPADVSLKETKQRDAGEVAECSPSEVNTVYSVSLRTMDEVADIYSAEVALEPTRNAGDHVAKNVPDEPSRPKSKPEALIAKTKDSLLSNSAKTSFVSIESSSSPTVSIQHLIFIMISLYHLY